MFISKKIQNYSRVITIVFILILLTIIFSGCLGFLELLTGPDSKVHLVFNTNDKIYIVGNFGSNTWLMVPDTSGDFTFIDKELYDENGYASNWSSLVDSELVLIANDRFCMGINSTGDRKYVSDFGGHTLSKSSDAYYLIDFYKTTIFNSNGDTLKTISSGGLPGSGVSDPIQKIVLLRRNGFDFRFLDGTLDTSITFQDNEIKIAQRIKVKQDGSIYIGGIVYTNTNQDNQGIVFLRKFSPSGELIWTVSKQSEPQPKIFSIYIDMDENIYLGLTYTSWLPTYEGEVQKYDQSGNYLYSMYLTGDYDEDYPSSILKIQNDEVWVVGYTYFYSPGHNSGSKGLIGLFDSTGSTRWTYQLEAGDFDSKYN